MTSKLEDFLKHQQEVHAWITRPNADVDEILSTILEGFPGVVHVPGVGYLKDGSPFNPILNREHLHELIRIEEIHRVLKSDDDTLLVVGSSKLEDGYVVIDISGVTTQEDFTTNELIACTTLLYILGEMRNGKFGNSV